MSRRLTGWVLTAAAIAAGPAPALSSNDPNQIPGQSFQTTVAQADALPSSDCLEVTTPHEAVKGGDVVVLKRPYPTSEANGDVGVDSVLSGDTDEQLRSAIDGSKRAGSGEAMQWLLLPTGKLMPQGAAQPTHVRAACGIPRGLTLRAPDAAATAI
jgi:hypothetical protein